MFLIPLLALAPQANIEARIDALLKQMTLEEKIGQMSQMGLPDRITPELRKEMQAGRWGSIYGWGKSANRAELQKLAKESRLHIPLIIGFDDIHGYATGLPIPLGQAASWDPELVRACTRFSAKEAASVGVNWTFSPMMDIARDPRWGRIAEGYGEDPFLASAMGVATVQGYQGTSLSDPDSLAACGKHYVGYGAAESGRDYNSTWIPEGELRDIYLKPFEATKKAGIATYMSAFNALNGVPASANPLTLRQILRKEWKFDGFVVSDYAAVHELIAHGVAADGAEAAQKAISAGVDMEMVSQEYFQNAAKLVKDRKLNPKDIDVAVRNILRIKFRMGLFDGRPQPAPATDPAPTPESLALAKKLSTESMVLLKNNASTLPLRTTGKVAVIGLLADNQSDQLGTWSSADSKYSVTALEALKSKLGAENVIYAPGILPPKGGRGSDAEVRGILADKNTDGFPAAVQAAKQADVVLVFLGENGNMSGEGFSRASIDLPGAQAELVDELAKLGKPIVGVVMAGRPLTFHDTTQKLSAVLYAWHPGTMAGPAITDVLFGDAIPTGKLPVTFPRSVGQIPIYYSQLPTGRPAAAEPTDHFRSKYIDIDFTPEYPFGYGLSYTTFQYSKATASASSVKMGGKIVFSCDVTNSGHFNSDEVVQFYTHQKSASVARPVRELKGFLRVALKAGQTKHVTFTLSTDELAFHNAKMKLVTEPGEFEAWIAKDSASGTPVAFRVTR